MTVYERIVELLENKKIPYRAFEHKPVVTCSEAAKVRGTKQSQGAKALICMADTIAIMLVGPCERKIDFGKFKKTIGIKDLRLATHEEVEKLTGLPIGAIPPLGGLFGMTTYVDKALGIEEDVVFNAGDRERSVMLKWGVYAKMESYIEEDFSKPN